MLDRASERAVDTLAEQPGVAVRVHQVLGDTYRGLGLYPEAIRQWRRAMLLSEQMATDPCDTSLAAPLIDLANLMLDFGYFASADSLFERLDTIVPGLSINSVYRFKAALARGGRYDMSGDFELAVASLEPALTEARLALGDEHVVTVDLQSALGNVMWQFGKPEQARDLLEASLATISRQEGPDDPACLRIMNNLASLHQQLDDLPRARDKFERLVKAKQWIMGAGHPTTAVGHHNLAAVLRDMGDLETAITNHKLAIAITDTSGEAREPRIFVLMAGYGRTLLVQEEFDEARSVYESCYGPLAEQFGSDHPRVSSIAGDLADIHDRLGNSSASTLWREKSGTGR